RGDGGGARPGRGGRVRFRVRADRCAKPRRRSPPIYAASRAPDGKGLVAEPCDFWVAEYKPGHRNFEANIERMAADIGDMDARAAKFGRRLRYAINPQVIVCETQDEAEALADAEESTAHARDRMVNALGAGLVGTPELLAERLRRYRAIGID